MKVLSDKEALAVFSYFQYPEGGYEYVSSRGKDMEAHSRGVDDEKIESVIATKSTDDNPRERFYEITFEGRPLGFGVDHDVDTQGNGVVVTSIQDDTLRQLGLTVGSRVYEVNGERVEGRKWEDIVQLLKQQTTPLTVTFKEVNALYVYPL